MTTKILVTGGAGYIGSHTVVSLTEAGLEPVIIDNYSNSEKKVIGRIEEIIQKPVIHYEGDCNDPSLLDKVLTEHPEIKGAIHFAAFKAVGESVAEPIKYYENNLNSLLVLSKKMIEKNVTNLVFSSSCTVYGEPDQLPVTEETPLKDAECPYGWTKKMCEQILKDFHVANLPLNIVALRYFNPIGAHPTGLIGELPIGIPNNLVPFVTQTAAGIREELVVFGDNYDTPDGSCIRDFIHVSDLADAHVKAFEFLKTKDGDSSFDVFNVGTGNGNSVLEVITTFEKVTGVKLNYRIGDRRPGDVEKIYANADLSEKILKWKATRTLEESLRDSWNWQKKISS